jgi:hypothetical protein
MFEEVTLTEALELFNTNDAKLLVMSVETCTATIDYVPYLQIAQAKGRYTTYYLDLNSIDTTTEEFKLFQEKLNLEYSFYVNVDKFSAFMSNTPQTVIIKNKEQVYGQNKYNHDKFSIGDNFIYKNDTNEDKYFLEVKAPNAVLPFIISDKLRKNNKIIKYNENDDTIKDNYKTAIATSFLTYAKKQNKNRKDLYFCIFNEDDNKTPIGMLFINLSNISDDDIDPNNTPKTDNDIIEKIKNLIDVDINDNTSSKATFKYTLKCDKNNEPIIKCNIHKDYIKQNKKDKMKEESLILSRDNFINEYYTNK